MEKEVFFKPFTTIDGFKYNESGVCVNAEKITLCQGKKRDRFQVLIAKTEDGKFIFATEYNFGDEGGGSWPSYKYGTRYDDKDDCIRAGIERARRFFSRKAEQAKWVSYDEDGNEIQVDKTGYIKSLVKQIDSFEESLTDLTLF